MNNTTIIAFANQKGGVGKTTSALNIGTGLALEGKKVLLIDLDPQANLTLGLSFEPDEMENTIGNLLEMLVKHQSLPDDLADYIQHSQENVNFIASDMNLENIQLSMQSMSGSSVKLLRRIIDRLVEQYDYFLIDCPPSTGALTYTALTASDYVIIPTQAETFSAKGLTQLWKHIRIVQEDLNPNHTVKGVLITMHNRISKSEKQVIDAIYEICGEVVSIFHNKIPRSVRAGESNNEGKSIHLYDPNGAIATAYRGCVKEVLNGNAGCSKA